MQPADGPVVHVDSGRERLAFGPATPVVTLGREAAAAVVLAHGDVSRRHLELRLHEGAWWLVDLGSTNGTLVAGARVSSLPLPPDQTVEVMVGGHRGLPLRLHVVSAPSTGAVPAAAVAPPVAATASPAASPAPPTVSTPSTPPAGSRVLGRSAVCDVVVDDPLASRRHARLDTTPGGAVLTDLGSFNGTFVNGERIAAPLRLQAGDEVIVGRQRLVFDGRDLAPGADLDEALVVEELTTEVAGGRRLIDGVDLELRRGTLTAVIGPSGSGKSTLLGALTGTQPAQYGHVIWQGHDLYTHYDQLRHQIGLVPQQDIQHPQLTVRQGLGYAARLRLPPDTARDERAARVEQVVAQMQLEQAAGRRIGTQLSGGQRKRVSIATELLTAPPLLFLDEPTSGLDPGLDRDVMHLLRGLADEGRVVVVVTHSLLALDICDTVVVMAPGGRIAYDGPPEAMLAHFGCRTAPEIFDLLDSPEVLSRLPERPARPGTERAPNPTLPSPPSQSIGRQLLTLVRRSLAVIAADRLLIAMLVLLPLLVGGMSRLAQGGDGLALARTADEQGLLDPGEAGQRLAILLIAAALTGAVMTIWALVDERAIFRREYAVGLSPGAYLMSKVLVFGTICFVQGFGFTWIATVGLPGPDDGGVVGLGWAEVALAMGLVAAVVAMIGLAVSAVLTSSQQGMPALLAIVLAQVLFSGAIVAVAGRVVLEQLSWLFPARWGYAAAGISIDLESAAVDPLGRLLPGATSDPLMRATTDQWVLDLVVLVVIGAVAVLAAYLLVLRSARRLR